MSENVNGSSQTPGSRLRRSFAVRAFIVGFVLLAFVGCGFIVVPMVASMFSDLADVAAGLFMLTTALAGHVAATWWAWRARAHWSRWLLFQTPYLVFYVLLYVWYLVPWSLEDGGPPPLGFLPWVGLASVVMSWLWVWWLDGGDRRNPKRAIAFLALFGVMVVGNGVAAGVVIYRTDTFGLRGQATPEDAARALAATSCLFTHNAYHRGGKPTLVDCPAPPRPDSRFDDLAATGQPEQVLQRWWDLYGRFVALPRLRYRAPVIEPSPAATDGESLVRLGVELPAQAEGQDLRKLAPSELWCVPDGRRAEVWLLRLESAPVGGWKVARIDIAEPVTLVPFQGSPCDRTTPTR